MARVWMVVAGTVVATALCAFLWHTTGMSDFRTKNERESQAVRDDIAKLTLYRDELKAKATGTPSMATGTISH